jgi:hypothetical protein
MRDVLTAINEAVSRLAVLDPKVSGAQLRCRLHPADYAQLRRQMHTRSSYDVRQLGVDVMRIATPAGMCDVEQSPSYIKGVVAVMVPSVYDVVGIRPLSYNVKLYECCDECGVHALQDEVPGGEELTQCKHTLAVSGCDAWLCDDCVERHDERVHVDLPARRERVRKEREERVAKAKADTLNDADYATRMRQKRAAKKAWVTRRNALAAGKAVVTIEGQEDDPIVLGVEKYTDA